MWQTFHENRPNLVKDKPTLRRLAKAGLIQWPVQVAGLGDQSKFHYVKAERGEFVYNGTKYSVRYHDGCFFPYLYVQPEEKS